MLTAILELAWCLVLTIVEHELGRVRRWWR